jgi:prolyl-tRNA editing enzyme YbaK/EbsC (Cys-tRNA(Pro) deacylase)
VSGSRESVDELLKKSGIPVEAREFGGSTRNSALAAKELGCAVEQIAKSVIFVGSKTVIVVLSGDRRVDARKLENSIGGSFRVATAAEVRKFTGYPAGGVPPFPHRAGVVVIPDTSLGRFEDVWAAAGTPNSVFRVRTMDLVGPVGIEPADLSAVD